MNLPAYMFYTWFRIAEEAEKSPNYEKQQQAEAIQEVFEEGR